MWVGKKRAKLEKARNKRKVGGKEGGKLEGEMAERKGPSRDSRASCIWKDSPGHRLFESPAVAHGGKWSYSCIANPNPLPVAAGAPASGAVVVVESGPVVYDDAAGEEEEEEEEEACVSAMELLGSNANQTHPAPSRIPPQTPQPPSPVAFLTPIISRDLSFEGFFFCLVLGKRPSVTLTAECHRVRKLNQIGVNGVENEGISLGCGAVQPPGSTAELNPAAAEPRAPVAPPLPFTNINPGRFLARMFSWIRVAPKSWLQLSTWSCYTSCDALLHPAVSCYALLHPAVPCYTLLRPAVPCYILRCPATSCYILLCPVTSFYVPLCPVTSFYVPLCPVTSCYVPLCPVTSCYVRRCTSSSSLYSSLSADKSFIPGLARCLLQTPLFAWERGIMSYVHMTLF
ncbi:hypothetical protein FQN60_012693 [Etheostoma spectabile]|uniref:Uncharacterized protein n=1 Tax=Etheostoma spectabile TaxID=54343 RepID=A0A5J5D3P2_9PERO|nr:hypothetical protein FQN60_012693 [Etheostoma spectabile]